MITSDDVSKRLPALFAGPTLSGHITKMTGSFHDSVSKQTAKIRKPSLAQIHLAKPKVNLKHKKNMIIALLVVNFGLVSATVNQDHASRVQEAQALEALVAPKTTTKTITIQPLKAPEGEVAEVVAEKVEPTPTPTPVVRQVAAASVVRINEGRAELMAAAGIPAELYSCVDGLVGRESGWRVNASNASSGAYGLGQALPGSKMAPYGADWQTNPVTQLKWMKSYVDARYGGFCNAYHFQLSHGWY